MSVLNDDQSTIRILSLDGGGMRGIFSMVGLKEIINRSGLSPSRLFESFDIITGTSIGGISALALAIGKTPDYILNLLKTKGPLIFDASVIPFVGKKHATWIDKVAFATGLESSLYPNSVLKQTMIDEFGAKKMSDIVGCCVVIPVVKYNYKILAGDIFPKNSSSEVFFSNMHYENLIGGETLIRDVAMATSAAPMYFPPYNIGNDTYLDGGMVQNNMSCFAFSLASQIKPNATKAVILSIGTGLGNIGVARDVSSTDQVVIPSGYQVLLDTMALAFSCPQEASDLMLKNFANGAGINLYHYRFNKILDPSADSELDSADDVAIQYFESEANSVLMADNDEINLFVQHLKS